MAFYGDPDELDRIAADIEQRADRVRTDGAEMMAESEGMRWQSIAAERCRELIGGDRRALDESADGLDAAAAVLRDHAQTVREMIAAIKRIAENVVNWFNGAVELFNKAVEGFNNAVRDIADGIGDALGLGGGEPPQPPRPPWSGWKWGPDNLPPDGDKAWLEVGDFMRRQGVPA